MNTNPTFWFSTLAILLSIVMSSLAVYTLLRLDTLSREVDFKTSENKGRIGRLIRELNIIHNKKRALDQEQSFMIRRADTKMDRVLLEHEMMSGVDGEQQNENENENESDWISAY